LILLPFLAFCQQKKETTKENKLSKFLITSFSVLGDEDLPSIGTIYDTKFYFFQHEAHEGLYFNMETSTNPKFLSGHLNKMESNSYFADDDRLENLAGYAIYEVDFLESPWKNLGLKSGLLHFTSLNVQPWKMVAFLYLDLPTGLRVIRLKGLYEDDLKQTVK
jgi:hypothetical protein